MTPAWLPDTITTVPDRMVERALLWGLEGLELCTVGGPADRVPHVNEARLRRRLDSSDLGVSAVVPGLFEGSAADRATWMNELALLSESLAFCRRLRSSLVVVSSFRSGDGVRRIADVLRRAGDAASRNGMRIAVLNEPDRSCVTGADLVELIGEADHPAVAAAWDPSVSVAGGEDPVDAARTMGGRVALVRYRAEERRVDWQHLLARLAAGGFGGPVSLVLPAGSRSMDGLTAASRLITAIRLARSGQSSKPA